MGTIHAMYGMPIREVMQRGNVEEMTQMLAASSWMLRNNADDTESDEYQDWERAHKDLVEAIASRSKIMMSPADVLAIKDGIVVIDSISLARALKEVMNSDVEGLYWEFKIGSK